LNLLRQRRSRWLSILAVRDGRRVADAGDLPRGGGLFGFLFSSLSQIKRFSATKPVLQERGGNLADEIKYATQIFRNFAARNADKPVLGRNLKFVKCNGRNLQHNHRLGIMRKASSKFLANHHPSDYGLAAGVFFRGL